MEKPPESPKQIEAHDCETHRRYDGGRKVNRDGVRVWIDTYFCSVCGRVLHIEEEILD